MATGRATTRGHADGGPYLGSIASAIPALLIAVTVDPMHVVYVGALYLAIHLADGYLLSPPLQRRAVHTPSLLVLASQLVGRVPIVV